MEAILLCDFSISCTDGPKLRSKHVHRIRFEFSFVIMAPKPFLIDGICHNGKFKAYCSHIDCMVERKISDLLFSPQLMLMAPGAWCNARTAAFELPNSHNTASLKSVLPPPPPYLEDKSGGGADMPTRQGRR